MDILSPTLRLALTGFMILVFAMGVGRFAFTPLLPMMQADGLLSVRDGGYLASVHFIGYAMGAVLSWRLNAPPKTVLVDRDGTNGRLFGLAHFSLGCRRV